MNHRINVKKSPLPTWLKALIVAVIIIGLFAAFSYSDLSSRLRDVLAWIENLGWIGIGAYILIYIAACVFLIPGSVLTLGAGVVFGVVKGSVIVSIASTLGATIAFLTGRYIARSWVVRQIEKRPFFRAIDEAISAEGWKIVLLTRLSPVFPFSLMNYALGLTPVKLKDYVLASWIGMLPGTVMYVYIGSLAGSLASLGGAADGRQRSTGEWALYGMGLLATLIVTVYVTRIAKRALSQKITKEE
ncbi:MAG: TVP38/TMEM64 family protein [Deltaproteobacteria bacterium]